MMRRKRLPDGSFGPLEKVNEEELTSEEEIEQIKKEKDQLEKKLDQAVIELTTAISMPAGGTS